MRTRLHYTLGTENKNNCSIGGVAVSRTILHADLNSFYASVECLYRPEIRDKPVVVGGDEEARHGIVLAKNNLAKKYGIQTAMSLMEARRLCPSLVVIQSDMPLYLRFAKEFRDILNDYSNCVESFGTDEAWLDISGIGVTIKDGERIANEIRKRTLTELGIPACGLFVRVTPSCVYASTSRILLTSTAFFPFLLIGITPLH